MNTVLLASDIVARVHHSPDSAINLATMVGHMIEQEIQRDACEEHNRRMATWKDVLDAWERHALLK